jgi:hypothetical protein
MYGSVYFRGVYSENTYVSVYVSEYASFFFALSPVLIPTPEADDTETLILQIHVCRYVSFFVPPSDSHSEGDGLTLMLPIHV